jgi:uncharacterized protein YndB with AHSA1/START domain
MSGNPEAIPAVPVFSMTRVLDAPRDLVWAVWTDPAHVTQWWGPHGFSLPVYEADLRPGGTLRYEMQAPDGTRYPSTGTFEEVVPPERIVTFGVVEISGTVAFEARTTVTFEEHANKTTVRVTQTYAKVTPAGNNAIAGASVGWTQQFEKLEAYLLAHARH